MIAGRWLKFWIETGAVLSAILLYEAQLSSSSFQLLGMADLCILPWIFLIQLFKLGDPSRISEFICLPSVTRARISEAVILHRRNAKWFHTPWVGIIFSSLITLAISFMSFTDIISSANFLYSLGILLEFASFLWLRRKHPTLKRPYRVPVGLPALVCMCLIPSAFLIFVMSIATWKVYVTSLGLTLLGIRVYYLVQHCRSKGCLEFKRGEDKGVEVEEATLLYVRKIQDISVVSLFALLLFVFIKLSLPIICIQI
ncbi:Amino acid/polyamine transporter I protein [Dioscorea alata]|uniref:Amino acid/polyamine transporter I protein n=1 Tax=Dioscorea alata TaxID=55571 RepID=A0ACB7TYF2_DIOAL|nr:Amino acid/polyamine transporter I protein [Dioscorea alata]